MHIYWCLHNKGVHEIKRRNSAGPIFPEIMHNTWKLKVIKYETKALRHSKMVVILYCITLI